MKEYLWLCRGKEVPVTQQTIKLALEKKGYTGGMSVGAGREQGA